MTISTVGLLSPGDMGHAIGAVLQQHGLRVMTCLSGRSQRTRALAQEANISEVPDEETLVCEADIILSILPPSRASACVQRVAGALRKTGASLLFADCNAIAPQTVQTLGEVIEAAGGTFVDVGIIGTPPRPGGSGPHLYASGPQSQELAQLNAYGLDLRVLGPSIGQASGLKMCFASLTKGFTALATEALVAGTALGLQEALVDEFRSLPHFAIMERSIPSMPPKAYRWVGEMEEIAKTFAALQLPPQMLEGAAALYRFVEGTALGKETPEQRQSGQTFNEVTSILVAALTAEQE